MELGTLIIKNKKIGSTTKLKNLIYFQLEKYNKKYECDSVPITSIKFENCVIEYTSVAIRGRIQDILSQVSSYHFSNCEIRYMNIETSSDSERHLSIWFSNSSVEYLKFYHCNENKSVLSSLSFNACSISNLSMENVTVLGHIMFNRCSFLKKHDNCKDNVIRNSTLGYNAIFDKCDIMSLVYENNKFVDNPYSDAMRSTVFKDSIIDNETIKESIIKISIPWENLRFRNTTIKSNNVINGYTCFHIMVPFSTTDNTDLYGMSYYYFPEADKLYEDLDTITVNDSFINSHKEENKNGYVTLDAFKELIKLDNSNVNAETYYRYKLVCKYFEEVKNLNTNE